MDAQNNLIYRVWLGLCCSFDPYKIGRLLQKYGHPKDIYENLHKKDKPLYTNEIRNKATLKDAENLIKYCENNHIKILSIDHNEYPKLLKNITLPPQLLFVKGNLPNLNRLLSISFVGSRKCSDDGKTMAKTLANDLAKEGVIIISGLAQGIDGAAHQGALMAGGITIAVLAGGVDVVYPASNRHLYKHILTHGAIISERPPKTIGKNFFYAQRNRIITGLSQGLVVVEGELKSGTSITAGYATELNRDVFAVPGNPSVKTSQLPNSLIKDGAKLVSCSDDILSEYSDIYEDFIKYGQTLVGQEFADFSDNEKSSSVILSEAEFDIDNFFKKVKPSPAGERVLGFINQQPGPVHFDDIAYNTGINAGTLGSTMIILEMKNAVRKLPGGRYIINRDI